MKFLAFVYNVTLFVTTSSYKCQIKIVFQLISHSFLQTYVAVDKESGLQAKVGPEKSLHYWQAACQ